MTKPTLTAAGTAITGALTVLAALPSELGAITTLIPPQYKVWIVGIAAVATAVLHVLHSSQVQDAAAASPGEAPKPAPARGAAIPLIIVGAILSIGFAAAACSTTTGNPSKDRAGRVTNAVLESAGDFVGRVALATLTNAAGGFASGGKLDMAHAAAAGLWAQAPSIITAADVQRVITAYSGGELDTVGAAAAAAFREAAPATPSDRSAVVNRLAQSISTAALDATGLP